MSAIRRDEELGGSESITTSVDRNCAWSGSSNRDARSCWVQGMRAHRAAGGVKVDRSGVVNRRVQGTRGSAGEGHSHEGEEEENAWHPPRTLSLQDSLDVRVKVNPWGPDRGLVHESNHTKHFFRHREAGDPARFWAGPCFCDLLAQRSRSHEESQEKVRNKIDDGI